MPYKYSHLPEYPVTNDLWDRLAGEHRPIVIYGMGNGADKLFDRLAAYGITPAAVFASDGFVRGHSFRGMRVMSLSEVEATFDDFVILLSFASNRPEVIEMLRAVNDRHEMYVPDMPVAGVDEYFDREHYNLHYREIRAAFDALADDESRATLAAAVWYKLTGKMEYLLDTYATEDELYSLIGDGVESYIDVGAYNGDTVRAAQKYFPHLRRVIALEPDPKTFRRLEKFAASVADLDLEIINAAALDTDGVAELQSAGNRNSTITATASYEHRATAVKTVRVDSLTESCDYIKYDVEGAEYEAILGSDGLIKRAHPTLLISLYHRSRDIYFLTNLMREKYPQYRLYIRRTLCLPAWEIALIAVPEEGSEM